MLNLFIDTNIFLNFYSYSSDYLNKLEQLKALLEAKQIQLFLPTQVIDEFNRNRDANLKEILKNLNSFPTELKIPVICQDLVEMKNVQEHLTNLSEARKRLVETVCRQIKSRTLKADTLIADIFSVSNVLTITSSLIDLARIRFDLGNPPGKYNSYGDAVNWEALLANVPENIDLYFVGRDKDYISVLEPSEFNSFLCSEWRKKKKSDIFFYDLLSKFLKDKFPDFKITDEEVKEEKTAAEQLPSGSLTGIPITRSYAFNPEIIARLAAKDVRLSALLESGAFQRLLEEDQRIMDFINKYPETLDRIKQILRSGDEIQRKLDNTK